MVIHNQDIILIQFILDDEIWFLIDIQSVVVNDGENLTVATSSTLDKKLIAEFAKKELLVSSKVLSEIKNSELVGPDGEDIIVSAENEGVVSISVIDELDDTNDAVEEIVDEKKGEPKSGKKSVVPKYI